MEPKRQVSTTRVRTSTRRLRPRRSGTGFGVLKTHTMQCIRSSIADHRGPGRQLFSTSSTRTPYRNHGWRFGAVSSWLRQSVHKSGSECLRSASRGEPNPLGPLHDRACRSHTYTELCIAREGRQILDLLQGVRAVSPTNKPPAPVAPRRILPARGKGRSRASSVIARAVRGLTSRYAFKSDTGSVSTLKN